VMPRRDTNCSSPWISLFSKGGVMLALLGFYR